MVLTGETVNCQKSVRNREVILSRIAAGVLHGTWARHALAEVGLGVPGGSFAAYFAKATPGLGG